jgi:hypothetical protein
MRDSKNSVITIPMTAALLIATTLWMFSPLPVRDGGNLSGELPDVTTSREPCDLNSDGNCDWNDYELFLQSDHMCKDDPPVFLPQYGFRRMYNPLADANHDGCVLGDDRRKLFPIIPEKKHNEPW